MSCEPVSEIICDLLFWLYLASAAYQDDRERLVIRGTHLMGIAAVGIYCLPAVFNLAAALPFGGAPTAASLLACLFCEGIYRHFSLYGLADSLVFLNCTLYYGVRSDAFLTFFLFWWLKAFSGLLFLMAQLLRCRRLRWRLKEPAPYIPCILGAFALTNIVLKGYNV